MRRNLSEPSPEYTMPQQYSSSPNFLDWVHMRRKKERKSKPCPYLMPPEQKWVHMIRN